MNIDLIKWMVGYAEGFEWIEPDRMDIPYGTWTVNDSCKDNPSWNFLIFPLLLQRAIEGVNRYTMNLEDDNQLCYIIFQNQAEIQVRVISVETPMKDHAFVYQEGVITIDQAKEQALKYIKEHSDEVD